MSKYIFTLDDNIRFFEECTKNHLDNPFEQPYLALLHEMHERYQTKFQLNTYFSYYPGSFSLDEVPDTWKDIFEKNSDWLRFSFHALHNDPSFPYERSKPEELKNDYMLVLNELKRIVGCAATNKTTTIHYVAATKEACSMLHECGLKGLVGMFYPTAGRTALRYYLSEDVSRNMWEHPIWKDSETGLWFIRNQAVLNKIDLKNICNTLDEIGESELYQVMIHEQYFYPDYHDYQEDFSEKVESAIRWFYTRGIKSAFFEEIIPA